MNTESQTKRWGEDLERRIFAEGPNGLLARRKRIKGFSLESGVNKEVPTLDEFWPTFISGHCLANRQKPSGIERKESVYRNWLKPRMGTKRLDEIGVRDVIGLKADLAKRSPKSANNALTAEEVEEGWILTCQGLPRGQTVTVEYEAM